MKLAGKTALVTGASSGIGREMARQLADMGATLVITARRRERLDELALEIEERSGVGVTVVVDDLGQPEAARRLWETTEGGGRTIDVLINNAGFGTQDPFLDIPWERTREQLQLNVVSLTELCWLFGGSMQSRGGGHILNVASTGAYQPVPHYATYSAGKTYVRNFSEALAHELAPAGVRVCCLCPGPTSTEFTEVAGHQTSSFERLFFMSAERCARIGLRSLFGWRRNVISGYANKLQCFLMRFVPRRTQVWGAALVMAKPTTALAKRDAPSE